MLSQERQGRQKEKEDKCTIAVSQNCFMERTTRWWSKKLQGYGERGGLAFGLK
jgi:hypothetical protein